MQIAILLFEHLTALDAVGPYEVLSRLPGAQTVFVGERLGPVRTDVGSLSLHVDATLAEVPAPDVVLVPGGFGQTAHMADGPVHEWLRAADRTSTWTTSVCTGSLVLAAARLPPRRPGSGPRRPTHRAPGDDALAGRRPAGRLGRGADRRTHRRRRQVRHRRGS